MTTLQHDQGPADELLDDLREVSGVLGCGYPVLPAARSGEPAAPDLAVLGEALSAYPAQDEEG